MDPQDTAAGDPEPPAALLAAVPAALRDAVDELVDPYLSILLACALRRARGEGPSGHGRRDGRSALPRLELPRAMRPFLRLRPEHAVTRPAVRAALFELAAADEPLRVMAAEEAVAAHARAHPDAPGSLVQLVADAVAEADDDALADAASLAVAVGGTDAVSALTLAGAATTAGRRRAEVDEAAAEAALASQRRHEEQTVERLRGDLTAAREAVTHAEAAADDARARRDELRAELATTTRRADDTASALRRAEEDLERRRAEVTALQAAVRRERESSRAALEREERLRAEIDRLRDLRVPDLEAPAAVLDDVAAGLRRLRDAMASGAGSDGGDVQEPATPGRRDGDASDGAPRRRTPAVPKGMRPDTPAYVRWAVGQRGFLVLVDGYNVCLQAQRGWSELRGDALRDLLTARLAAAHRPGGAEFHVVFDGDPSVADGIAVAARFPDGVRWEFTRTETADDRIVELCAVLPAERTILVVTSDRELQSRVAGEGAVVVPSPVLLEAVGAPRRQ